MTTRTDAHRKGAIVPAEYEYVFSYNLSTTELGWPVPSCGVNCELDGRREVREAGQPRRFVNGEHRPDGRCCIIGLRNVARVPFAVHGGTGRCTTCGARFIYGDVWMHVPTGEYIHLGHDCADKYGLLADRSSHELALGRVRAAAAVVAQRAVNEERRDATVLKHPGLAAAFALADRHPILADLAAKALRFELSEKQVALALKLADEVMHPKPVEALVAAPVEGGRQVIEGEVISLKTYESDFGTSLKMTLKVTTPAGAWLAWGTCPAALACGRGSRVRLVATLKAGREPHFALFSRPAKAVVLAVAP